MKFDQERNKAYLDFDNFISCNGAIIDKEFTKRELTGQDHWYQLAEEKYNALPDIDVNYDSTLDTLRHVRRVSILLNQLSIELLSRANKHDDSKFGPAEKPHFDRETPILKGLTYGTQEYSVSLKALGVALTHHYGHNSHHPEHYPNGVNDMDLIDVVEMLLDWVAASERHDDGNIYESIEKNKVRFALSDQLAAIFKNTIDRRNLYFNPGPVKS